MKNYGVMFGFLLIVIALIWQYCMLIKEDRRTKYLLVINKDIKFFSNIKDLELFIKSISSDKLSYLVFIKENNEYVFFASKLSED